MFFLSLKSKQILLEQMINLHLQQTQHNVLNSDGFVLKLQYQLHTTEKFHHPEYPLFTHFIKPQTFATGYFHLGISFDIKNMESFNV